MRIYLHHEYNNVFGIYYKQSPNKEYRWACNTVYNLPQYMPEITKEILVSAAQDSEIYEQLRNLILYLADHTAECLWLQSRKVTSFSELEFCEYLQPLADQITQVLSAWLGNSSNQISVPNLLEGL